MRSKPDAEVLMLELKWILLYFSLRNSLCHCVFIDEFSIRADNFSSYSWNKSGERDTIFLPTKPVSFNCLLALGEGASKFISVSKDKTSSLLFVGFLKSLIRYLTES